MEAVLQQVWELTQKQITGLEGEEGGCDTSAQPAGELIQWGCSALTE